MSRKFIVILSTGLALTVFAGAFVLRNFNKINNRTGENLSKQPKVEIVELDTTVDRNNMPMSVEATYADYSTSLKEMKKASDAIVIAKPTSYNQLKVGVVSTVSVLKTLKGKKFDEILIYQIGQVKEDNTILTGDVLELNKEYVLFLGEQTGAEDNAFYVKAGIQGAFLNENGKLTNKDTTMQDDVKKILKDKKSEYESLLDYAIE